MRDIRKLGLGSSIWAALLTACFVVSVCTPTTLAAGKKADKKKVRAELVWPLPPDAPRIRWVDAFARFEDIEGKKKKKRSWFERLAGVSEEEEKYRGLTSPFGIVTDSRGRVFVADWSSGGIVIFDRDAKKVGVWGPITGVPIRKPLGLAIDDDDRLFVTDGDLGLVTCLSAEGVPLAQFGRAELDRPTGIALDQKRNRLYVSDTKAHRIAVFDSETFEFQRYIGRKSAAREPGTFRSPLGLAVDGRGFLYVVDTMNRRIQIFNRRGVFVREFGSHGRRPGQFSRPKGIALDSEGHIYVTDAEFNNFQIFDNKGKALMFVGTIGSNPGQFILITDIFIDKDDRIYTTERYRPRVQIFQYLSQPEEAAPKEVTAGN